VRYFTAYWLGQNKLSLWKKGLLLWRN